MSAKSQTTYWLGYHNTDPATMFLPQPRLWDSPECETRYRLVALVQAASLEEVYRLTNHLDRDWRENAAVKAVAVPPPRSTSVGDVIVHTEDGQAWLVQPTGFTSLFS